MNAPVKLLFHLVGVGIGLTIRGVFGVMEILNGETEIQYLQRKYPNLLVKSWTDGTD